MLKRLISEFFKMSKPPKRVKVTYKRGKLLDSDEESLETLSHKELIQRVVRLKAQNINLINIIKKGKNPPIGSSKKSNKKIDFDGAAKRRVFLKFFYLGWDYEGFVSQINTSDTVEDNVINALKKCALIETREKCNYQKCGRTDKGVSAFSQVISLDLRSKLSEPGPENIKDEYNYCAMLNRVLPSNIKCYAWAHVNSDANARYDCSSRTYKYYFPKGDLDIEAMLKGAKFLLGTHDFRNFCKMDVGNGVIEFIRNINFTDITPCLSAGNEMLGYQIFEFVIQGSGFLHHQIRCIMTVLFLIGQGKESPDIIKRLLDIEENPCKPQYTPAHPLPLNLFDVEYEGVVNNWNIDEESLSKCILILQKYRTEYSIKTAMIKDMIGNLEKFGSSSHSFDKQVELLMLDVKRKTYLPLLSREKCDALEEKIESYIKKGKIERVNS